MKQIFVTKIFFGLLTFTIFFVGGNAIAEGNSKRAGVYIEQSCPVSQVSAKSRETGVLEIIALKVLGRVVEGAINTGSAMLKEAAKDESIKTAVANSTYLYATDGLGGVGLNPDFVCLVFFSGTSGSWNSKRILSSSQEQNLRGFSEREQLQDFPDFYFEALIEPSHDGAYFRLRPKSIRYAKSLSRGFGSKSTSAFLTVAFGDPSKEGDHYQFGSAALPLPSQGLENSITNVSKQNVATGWIPMLALAPDNATSQDLITEEQAPFVEREQLKAAIEMLRSQLSVEAKELVAIRAKACRLASKQGAEDSFCPSEYKSLVTMYGAEQKKIAARGDLDAKIKRLAAVEARIGEIKATVSKAAQTRSRVGSKLVPIDFNATLVETVEASKFLKILANAVGEVAPTAAAAARERIDPDEKAAKREKDEIALQAKITAGGILESTALTELTNVQIAEATLADLPLDATRLDRATLESNVRIAKLKANIAFRKLNRPEPFPAVF